MKKVLSLVACIGLSLALNAQNKKVFGTKDGELIHESSESYEWPTDAKVLEKLDKWQDVKFGIMYHWGIYSVPGITESWLLCSEDRFTKRRERVAPDKPYDEFKKWYWGLARQDKDIVAVTTDARGSVTLGAKQNEKIA